MIFLLPSQTFHICCLPSPLSGCRSWLGHCRTHWNCGTEYEFQVFQTLPVPPCANPGPNFVPPIEPGMCEFDIEKSVCDFNGISECTPLKIGRAGVSPPGHTAGLYIPTLISLLHLYALSSRGDSLGTFLISHC